MNIRLGRLWVAITLAMLIVFAGSSYANGPNAPNIAQNSTVLTAPMDTGQLNDLNSAIDAIGTYIDATILTGNNGDARTGTWLATAATINAANDATPANLKEAVYEFILPTADAVTQIANTFANADNGEMIVPMGIVNSSTENCANSVANTTAEASYDVILPNLALDIRLASPDAFGAELEGGALMGAELAVTGSNLIAN